MIFQRINKKGADKILSIYWFFILVIIAGSIFTMVNLFYKSPIDVRLTEANILINKVSSCISSNGQLNSNLFLEDSFNGDFSILNSCNISFNTEEDFKDKIQYYVEVKFSGSDNVFDLEEGNGILKSSCQIQDKKKYNTLVKCANRTFYSLGPSETLYGVNIYSIIRKTEKNAN